MSSSSAFLFTLGWTLSYVLVTRARSLPKAILAVSLLFGSMLLFDTWSHEHVNSLSGWLIGITTGFFVGLQIVQRYGPEDLTEEGAVAVLFAGPLIFAVLLVVVVLFL